MNRAPLVVVWLTLLALALRLWNIEFQSLWWDEGVSIYLAGAGLRALTVGKDFSVDLHPPGYHVLLALWQTMLGPSVFSDRLLSVVAGVATIPLVFALTRATAGWPNVSGGERAAHEGETPAPTSAIRWAPPIAALLAAVSPIDVFYSQESRMYPFLPLLGVASLYATLSLLRQPTGRRWLVWVVVTLVGWYVYYYLAWLTLAESLVLLAAVAGLLGERQPPVNPVPALAAHAALVVGYLPWLAIGYWRARDTSLALPPETATHPSPFGFLVDMWRAFSIGFIEPPGGIAFEALWAALAVVGVGVLARRNRSLAILLLLSAVVPVIGSAALLLLRPFFYPRFILFVLGPIWTLVAITITSIHRSWLVSAAVLGILVAGGGWTWYRERITPRSGYSSSDYRVVFDSLAASIEVGDVVLGGYPWELGYARAYFWQKNPRTLFIPRGTEAATIDRVSAGSGRTWVISYDPAGQFGNHPLEGILAARNVTLAVDQFADTRLRLFGHPTVSAGPAADDAIVCFDNEIELVAAKVNTSFVPPGKVFPVVLRWRALRQPRSDDTVFVHLIAPDGSLRGQHDAPPIGGAFPTRGWTPAEVVVDRHLVTVNSDAPPGQYQVVIGLYHPDTGRRLVVGPRPLRDDQFVVGTLVVRPE